MPEIMYRGSPELFLLMFSFSVLKPCKLTLGSFNFKNKELSQQGWNWTVFPCITLISSIIALCKNIDALKIVRRQFN